MSVLLEKIRRNYPEAATVFEDADLRTDSDIQSLTQNDLHELFPGAKKLKLRRAIFKIIHEKKSIEEVINELKAFIPRGYLKAALTGNGVLVEYLDILKDMKTQMNDLQGFLDAQIVFLEQSSKDQPDFSSDISSDTSTTDTRQSVVTHSDQSGVSLQGTQETSGTSGPVESHTAPACDPAPGIKPTVTCQVVVCGKTFNAHVQLMEKVKNQAECRVCFAENPVDYQITIVFCAISSRKGSDVSAAMSNVKGDKPVILVLMHHMYEAKSTGHVETHPKVVLLVDIFYHETKYGLLRCSQNDDAVSKIVNELSIHLHPAGGGVKRNGWQ